MLAVIVLYKMRAEESPAYQSLTAALEHSTALHNETPALELMLCDNTPQQQSAPQDFDGPYLRDTSNPGLAHWYNVALERAVAQGPSWLMLLDQDTTVNAEYLQEVIATVAALQKDARVVALTPKLVEHGAICSPAMPPVLGPAPAVDQDTFGISNRRLIPFNSGAVLRVAALQQAGGFAAEFPLDYLDHATFAALQDRGGLLYVLRASLQHALSSNTERTDEAAARRQESVLAAERRFYAKHGTPAQRWLRRVRLLKAVAGRVLRRKEAGQTWRMLKSALRP